MNRDEYKKFKEMRDKQQKIIDSHKIQFRNFENDNSIPHAYEIGTKFFYDEIVIREEDNVYVNIVFNHNPPANYINTPTGAPTGEQDTPADYSVTETIPILDKASDYYCSVIRFTIPLDALPILICPIIPNTNNIALSNKTPMVMNILYNGINYPINLQFLTENTITVIDPPLQNQLTQVVTPYYYIYTYQTIINMYNIALNSIWISSGLAALFPGILAPYFILDQVTELISIIVPKCFTQLTAPAVSIPILSQNIASVRFMTNFYSKFNGYNQPNGNDLFFNFGGVTVGLINYPPAEYTYPVPFTPLTTDYYKFTQESSSLQYWPSIRRIIFTTAGIPVNPESIPSEKENASQAILTDFIIDTSNIGNVRSIAYFVPTAQYRLIDLNSDTPLQKLNIRIFWQDTIGNIYPLGITIFQQASLKLLFTRKSLYKK